MALSSLLLFSPPYPTPSYSLSAMDSLTTELKAQRDDIKALYQEYYAIEKQIQDKKWSYVHKKMSPKETVNATMDKLGVFLRGLGVSDYSKFIADCKANLTMAPIYNYLNVGEGGEVYYTQTILYEWQGKRVSFTRIVDKPLDIFTEHLGGFTLDGIQGCDLQSEFRGYDWWITELPHTEEDKALLNTKIEEYAKFALRDHSKFADYLSAIPEPFRLIFVLFLMNKERHYVCQSLDIVKSYDEVWRE